MPSRDCTADSSNFSSAADAISTSASRHRETQGQEESVVEDGGSFRQAFTELDYDR